MTQSLETIGLAALSNAGDFRTSYELAARCIREGIPGEFVECGVFGGSQSAAMAKAILDAQCEIADCPDCAPLRRRRVHLFDSFEGCPEPGPEDRDFVAGGNGKGTSACSLEAVQANMAQWGIPGELLVYHKGWFERDCYGVSWWRQDEMQDPPMFPNKIAILRIDLDMYAGTLAALHRLYHLVSPGGFCIIDDYALDGCRQAVNEFMGGGFPPITWQKA